MIKQSVTGGKYFTHFVYVTAMLVVTFCKCEDHATFNRAMPCDILLKF